MPTKENLKTGALYLSMLHWQCYETIILFIHTKIYIYILEKFTMKKWTEKFGSSCVLFVILIEKNKQRKTKQTKKTNKKKKQANKKKTNKQKNKQTKKKEKRGAFPHSSSSWYPTKNVGKNVGNLISSLGECSVG